MAETRSGSVVRGAGLLRRLAALVYDSVLLSAVLFAATACVLPFNGGEALEPRQWLYPAYLLSVSAFFFGWFWTHGGQTLGMKAWGLRVCTHDGQPLGWRQAGARILASCVTFGTLGLGYLWVLVDPKQLTWHDRLSGTRVEHRACSSVASQSPSSSPYEAE